MRIFIALLIVLALTGCASAQEDAALEQRIQSAIPELTSVYADTTGNVTVKLSAEKEQLGSTADTIGTETAQRVRSTFSGVRSVTVQDVNGRPLAMYQPQ